MAKAETREHDLVHAAREMLAHQRGKIALPARKVTAPESIDVAAVRKRFGYSQQQFANQFGFALSAVKDWEQGCRKPERSGRILLAVIATYPKVCGEGATQFSGLADCCTAPA